MNENQPRRAQRTRSVLRAVRNGLAILIVVAAITVLLSTFAFPTLRMYGNSMNPTLFEGDVIVGVKTTRLQAGDIIAFTVNNEILVKRVIAVQGQTVEIDRQGYVTVDGQLLDEPYVAGRALGTSDITFPYEVPEGRFFVMGDHRATSLDSRTKAVGCVAPEQIIGKLVFRIWPLSSLGRTG